MTFNPGTQPIANTTEENARHNMSMFRIAVRKVAYNDFEPGEIALDSYRNAANDHGHGWYCFMLVGFTVGGAKEVEIQMPGVPLEQVQGSLLEAPRLYVDGNSWWWEYAVNVAAGFFSIQDGQ